MRTTERPLTGIHIPGQYLWLEKFDEIINWMFVPCVILYELSVKKLQKSKEKNLTSAAVASALEFGLDIGKIIGLLVFSAMAEHTS